LSGVADLQGLQGLLSQFHPYNYGWDCKEHEVAVYALDDGVPQISASAWVADSATVVGRVTLEEEASIWYGAVARADSAEIRIGARSNIQDNSVLHVDIGKPLIIGCDVTVGHQVMLHGCTVGDGSLIGIQAVVLNGAKIGKNCMVAAGSVVTEGKEFPDGVLIMGAPAKVVRELSPEQVARIKMSAAHYVENFQQHRRGLKKLA
jgi:carbonic anhydrase/acetyltransferase-like protein (isoleucine patch superfamily)